MGMVQAVLGGEIGEWEAARRLERDQWADMQMEVDRQLRRIGVNISLRREAAEMSREQLAAKVCITPGYLGRVERGESRPSLVLAIRLGIALGSSLSELLILPDVVHSVPLEE